MNAVERFRRAETCALAYLIFAVAVLMAMGITAELPELPGVLMGLIAWAHFRHKN